MKFVVQSINRITETSENSVAISHYEIDLVDLQMHSNWQSSITLRVDKEDVSMYYVGQNFNLSIDSEAEKNHSFRFEKYFDGDMW